MGGVDPTLGHDVELLQAVSRAIGGEVDGVDDVVMVGRGIAGATTGVWRITGRSNGDAFNLFCKILAHDAADDRRWRSDEEPSAPYWWRREAEFYLSTLAATDVAFCLRPPRCLHVTERPDGAVALWLEDAGTAQKNWAVADLARASWCLGHWQARLTREQRNLPFLSHRWLRAYSDRHHPLELPLVGASADATVKRLGLSAEVLDLLAEADDRRGELLDLLDTVPVAVCHNDFHPANLFSNSTGNGFVVIDWAYVGLGPLGSDAGNLAVDAGFDFWLDQMDQRDERAERLLASYLAGLMAGGWRGDQALVRRGFFAAIAAKYPWTLAALIAAATRAEDDPEATLNGKPVDLATPAWADSVRQVAGAARIALAELGSLKP